MDDYRITSAIEIEALLQRLLDGNTLITLSGPGGVSYTTMLWSMDADRGTVCFSAESGDSRVQTLLETHEVVAVAYLDSIKLQFDLDGLVQVSSGQGTAINARYPRLLYRFQRRSSYRVKPLVTHSPTANFAHPAVPSLQVSLRILDISLGGVALFLPHTIPMVAAGAQIKPCFIDLDSDTRLEVGLIIHHVSVINPESQGARLGCELRGIKGLNERALQLYIDQTQKRRLALSSTPD